MVDLKEFIETANQDLIELALILIGTIVFWFVLWVFYKKNKKKTSAPIPSNPTSSEPTPRSTKTITIERSRKPSNDRRESFTTSKENSPKKDYVGERKSSSQVKEEKPPTITTIDPEPEEQSQPKRIGYNPVNIFAQNEPYSYPYVIMPKPKSWIKFPRKGRTGRKGFKEEDFKTYLKRFFSNEFKIYDDRFITVKGNNSPFEPDITFTNEKDGINIFMDIEIDEPYEGINDINRRKPTHFQYSDTDRNRAFRNRGLIVIRFAEIQVHQEPLKCCLFVSDVIKSIYPRFKIPDVLSKVSKLTSIPQWTKKQAEQWSEEKYRERYLGIDAFGKVPETEKLNNVQETELGQFVENNVEDDPPYTPPNETIQENESTNKKIITKAIHNSKYLSFKYHNKKTITRPMRFNDNTLKAYCYVRNKEKDFLYSEIISPSIKQKPFVIEETGPNLGVETIKNVVNTAIQYGRYIRMRYTRSAWTEMKVDKETGEVIMEKTEAEESIRTINDIGLSINTLDQEHIDHYNLDENYITAYCNKREDQRTFRFDRISEIAVLDI